MDTEKTDELTASSERVLNNLESAEFVLRLYVADGLASSIAAMRNIETLCREYPEDSFDLKIIDIYKEPRMARREQIVATPTLVKERPLPVRRFVGTLFNREALLAGLGLPPH